jgi:hypothetical protein
MFNSLVKLDGTMYRQFKTLVRTMLVGRRLVVAAMLVLSNVPPFYEARSRSVSWRILFRVSTLIAKSYAMGLMGMMSQV